MATKGIWVSTEILHDNNLSSNEKFILAEIEQLSSLDDGCYAHNKHFAELVGTTTRTVTRVITSLEEKGYIKIETKPGSRNHVRELSTLDKMSNPPRQNVQTPPTKCLETKGNKQTNKQINKQEEFFPDLNEEAFSMWCEHKGSKYTKQAKTISRNKLMKHDKATQLEMVEASIMNGWKGLFEPKGNAPKKKEEAEPGSIWWQYAREAEKKEVIDVQIEAS